MVLGEAGLPPRTTGLGGAGLWHCRGGRGAVFVIGFVVCALVVFFTEYWHSILTSKKMSASNLKMGGRRLC